ncbi:regulatory protein YlbF [Marinithermofilum abyssi]|uniref:Regulatory protein YlbF n=1 Tax=Marinithermofilum abyssi TaxID=1571185 RepID=A0A8J2VCZ0_9BACL|nr:YlbF family regulator [Marinithermofilum abyssi]GGE19199.1 regulatory protein YlbF [Marinithermofilum abyssi]
MNTINMADLLLEAYDLADAINESEEVRRYLAAKRRVQEDAQAQRLIREFQRKKELFDDAQRFGHFHPDYHKAKEEAEAFLRRMRENPVIGEYMEAEEQLDELLGEVSRIIARSVSDTIKVPVNDPRGLRKANKRRCG